jgi:hypothetical protein
MSSRPLSVLCVAALALLAACPDRPIAPLQPTQAGEVIKNIPISADIDVLFVIDDSASTADKQQVFAANFPRFIQALDAFPTGRPNLHVGVVSTSIDVGVDGFGAACHPASDGDGRLRSAPQTAGCAAPTGRFLVDLKQPDGSRQTNFTGTLESALSCVAQLGTAGCGFESPLEAMKRALDGSRPENAGFVRPGAYLAVIFLTDEDDCSAKGPALFGLPSAAAGPGDFRCQPLHAYQCDQAISPSAPGSYTNCKVSTDGFLELPSRYVEFLTQLKGPSQVAVALIAGDPTPNLSTGPIAAPFMQTLALQPSCHATINGNLAIGRPALRLASFANQFGDRGLFRSVCQSDYSQILGDIGQLLFEAVSPCLDTKVGVADIDPVSPGVQLDCTVTDIEHLNTPDQREAIVPRCPMADDHTLAPGAGHPCYWLEPAGPTCGGSGLQLHVERSAPPSTGTTVQVSCATT